MCSKVPRLSRQCGVTLAEMMIVVAILAVATAVAIPSADTVTPLRSDAAAGEIARVLRFAQREAVRTNAWYQVKFDTTAQTVRVYRLAISSTATEDVQNPTVNPIDKMPYALSFRSGPASTAITAVAIDYGKKGTQAPTISFDATGTPGDIQGNEKKDIYALVSARITVANDRQTRNIDIDPLTGRVAVTSG